MLIAVSATGADLGSNVDPRFGRCRFLVFFDTESGKWEAVANENIDASGGAGIRTAQLVLDRGAAAVITGNVGPNAMGVLSGGGIPVYTGFSGTVESALQAYREGSLNAAAGPTANAHAGMQGGGMPGGGMGGGMPGGGMGGGGMGGGGMGGGGMGGGRGGGRGRGRGSW